MNVLVNQFNRYEVPLILIWLLVLALYQYTTLPIGPLVILLSCLLALGVQLQGVVGGKALADRKGFVRIYPKMYGYASATAVLGVMFKVMNYPGSSIMAQVGTVGLLLCTVVLFYRPVQDEFLPVMKKMLLRLLVLLVLLIWIAV